MFFFFLMVYDVLFFFFFFQAEDGIRDRDVTGVQTCALPIFWNCVILLGGWQISGITQFQTGNPCGIAVNNDYVGVGPPDGSMDASTSGLPYRSEERRVGKECGARWWRERWKRRGE